MYVPYKDINHSKVSGLVGRLEFGKGVGKGSESERRTRMC